MMLMRREPADERCGLFGNDSGRTKGDVRPDLGEVAQEGMRFHGLGN